MSVTKHGFLNVVIGLLVIVTMVLLCKPCYFTENDSASVMSYVCMPTYHEEITDLMKEHNPDFVLNGQVIGPYLMFIFGFVSLVLLVMKRNMTKALYGPIVFSVLGILVCWTNELTRIGGVTVAPTIVMLAILVLCAFNGNWLPDPEGASWKADPNANSKLKDIEKAVARKRLETLKAYAQSTDVSVRTAAIDGIAKVGGGEAFNALVIQLSCSNPEIRIAAAKAIGELGDQRGRTYLLHFMESDHASRVRSAMTSALGKLPSFVE